MIKNKTMRPLLEKLLKKCQSKEVNWRYSEDGYEVLFSKTLKLTIQLCEMPASPDFLTTELICNGNVIFTLKSEEARVDEDAKKDWEINKQIMEEAHNYMLDVDSVIGLIEMKLNSNETIGK